MPAIVVRDLVKHYGDIKAKCLPLYYLGDALRQVMVRGESLAAVWLDIVVLVAVGLACFAISVKMFRWE